MKNGVPPMVDDSRNTSKRCHFDGAVSIKRGESRRLFGVKHHGGSVLFDRQDTFGVALTLSETHGVEWRQATRTRNAPPRIGLSSMMPPGVPTRVSTRGTCRLLRLDLPWLELTSWIAEDFGVDSGRVELQSRFQADDPTLARLLYAAMSDREAEEGGVRSIAAHLWTYHRGIGRGGDRQGRSGRGGLTPASMRRVHDVLETAEDGSPSIAEMARAVGLSPFHFAREFERTAGEPPHRFVLRKRINRAIGLMADPELTIDDVAKRTGFSHGSHLARQMRRVTGMSPAAFRDQVLP